MPRGPRGEKRPRDVIGNAVKVMRIAIVRDRPADNNLILVRVGSGSHSGCYNPIAEAYDA